MGDLETPCIWNTYVVYADPDNLGKGGWHPSGFLSPSVVRFAMFLSHEEAEST